MIKMPVFIYNPFDHKYEFDKDIYISEAHICAVEPFGKYTKVVLCNEAQTYYITDVEPIKLSKKVDRYRAKFGFFNHSDSSIPLQDGFFDKEKKKTESE